MEDRERQSSGLHLHQRTRRERFFAGYTWLVLKNAVGWTLILLSLVAGPLVPGPGGIPLFLVGFALASFPGKRKLTARVMRGRPVHVRGLAMVLTIAAISLILPALALRLFSERLDLLQRFYGEGVPNQVFSYAVGTLVVFGLVLLGVSSLNLILRWMPAIRRKVRPWLRRHRIRLLPPRWRERHSHETGAGPFRLRDEILGFVKRHHHRPKVQ